MNRDIYDRYHDIERENNNLANLYVASFQLHSTMELRELTQIILEILLNFVGAKTFAIQLVDDDHGKLRTLASEGIERGKVPEGAVDEGHVGEVIKSGHHYIDGERLRARADVQHLDRPVIVVPLKIREQRRRRDHHLGSPVAEDRARRRRLRAVQPLGRPRRVGAARRVAGDRAEGTHAAPVGRGGSGLERAMATALVVEDSPTMRQLIVFALRRIRGLEVLEADDGVDALRKLAASKLDIILTDINMPIMDGLKLVKRVRTDEALKGIPIIIITTEGAEEDRQRALALGANAYITKPIQAPQVIAKVKELLKIA